MPPLYDNMLTARSVDGGSIMQDNSSPELSDDDQILSTPSHQHCATPTTPINPGAQPTSELSPPDSREQSTSNIRTISPPPNPNMAGNEELNANGKRSFEVATGSPTSAGATSTSGSKGNKPKNKHHAGYTWDKEEDAPGYAWSNEKAQNEAARALSQIFDLDLQIKGRYGDVLDDRQQK